mgnify:CR=1 FL=1
MKIRSCASSANLGPGFDTLGIAWQCWNDIDIEKAEGLSVTGCEERFRGPDNLVYRAYEAAMNYAGVSADGVAIRFSDCHIPVSRGLGSSSALITAGVLGANELNGLGLSREELFSIAARLEGHPDNVAPALFGGFTAAATVAGESRYVSFSVSEKLYFTALIPDFELSTALSRSVLPADYPRVDAVFNLSRLPFLIRALETGDRELLRLGLQDRIHQSYRLPLIRGYDKAESLVKVCGGAELCISGAGSTLLCVAENAEFSGRLAAAAKEELPGWQVRPLLPDMKGVRVIG